MTQPRLKFWGWGRESEVLSSEEVAQLERAYAAHFGVARFERNRCRVPKRSSCARRACGSRAA
jgi:hypothetical protein